MSDRGCHAQRAAQMVGLINRICTSEHEGEIAYQVLDKLYEATNGVIDEDYWGSISITVQVKNGKPACVRIGGEKVYQI